MRKLAAVLLLLSASAVYAQRPRPKTDMPRSGPLMFGVEQYTAQLQDLSAAVKRDAFIVAQMVAATGELHDEFQKHNALEKAHDHVEAALRRATDNPPAPGPVVTATRSSAAKGSPDSFITRPISGISASACPRFIDSDSIAISLLVPVSRMAAAQASSAVSMARISIG